MSKSLLDLLNKTRGDIASKRGNNIDLTRLKDGNNYLRIFPNKDEQVVKIIARVAKHLNHDAIKFDEAAASKRINESKGA
ncbi:hypothetical protein EC2865200_4807 [Escherichia coli 2865200]|nr:hypothetical protein EC2865200_4807 [Escherichia coli 2865200]